MSVSKTLSIGLIIIVVVLAVIAGFFAYEWYAAENNYHALYAQYVSLQSNYTALEQVLGIADKLHKPTKPIQLTSKSI
ncbi:hypothetical protein [Vulcanisaeta sp. JCM 16159]|uniref:hypothetical protein n=1 Tax=Vulcanisaeta sp. JCM 16159 TaxID=1295371 RepID=UPI0006D1E11C|nr:hypothetical protein [Vulcanisaeta sp. JCM 16159]